MATRKKTDIHTRLAMQSCKCGARSGSYIALCVSLQKQNWLFQPQSGYSDCRQAEETVVNVFC